MILLPIIGVAAGLLAWPAVEYAVHGILCHRLKGPAARLHATHHRDPRKVFTPLGVWIPTSALLALVASALVGPALGLGFTAGLVACFLRYEHRHWRFHFRAPRSAREARLRAHHLAHHRVDPNAYHGVTTVLVDRAMGTLPADHDAAYARGAATAPLPGRSNFGRIF